MIEQALSAPRRGAQDGVSAASPSRVHIRATSLAWLRDVGPSALLAVGLSAVYLAVALTAPAAVSPGAEGFGYTGDTSLHGVMRWDGAWYAAIAEHGYSTATGRYQSFAFFPLFPSVVAAVHMIVPFVSVPLAGLVVNVIATVGAAMLVDRTVSEWPRPQRLVAVAAVLAVPSAFFDVMFYSEGLFLFASALVIWSVADRRRLWLAPAGVVLATLDRPVGLLLLVLVAAALLHDSRSTRRRIAILLCSCSGVIVVLFVYWHVAGDPFTFIAAQNGWTSLRTLGPGDAIRWLVVQLNPATSTNHVATFGYWELLIVALPLLLLIRRERAAVYAAVAILAALVLGGVGTQSRYLAAILPLWLTAVIVLRQRLPARVWTATVAAGALGGLACNIWLVSRFASGLWAG